MTHKFTNQFLSVKFSNSFQTLDLDSNFENQLSPYYIMSSEEKKDRTFVEGNLNEANPQQREIIDYLLDTPHNELKELTLSMAYPGTGKTFVIYLLLQELMRRKKLQISCSQVLFLSFNKQNITDLNLKIDQLANSHEVAQLRTRIHTFHCFAMKITGKEKVIQKQEEADMRRKIFQNLLITVTEKKNHFKSVVDELFSDGVTAEDWSSAIDRETTKSSEIGQALRSYKQAIEKKYLDEGAVSFDYSLIKAVKELQRQENNSINLRKNKLLIVDQFQDMNGAQIKMVQAIMKLNENMKLALFGDIDQNIYGWRGSKMHLIDEFINEFSGRTKVMRLVESQRLTPSCLNLSINLINSHIGYKMLREDNKYYGEYKPKTKSIQQDFKPVITKFESEISEAVEIVDQIEMLHYERGVPFQEMALVFEKLKDNSLYSKIRIEIHRRKKDPTKRGREIYYQVHDESKVFSQPIIKQLLAYFSYLNAILGKKYHQIQVANEIQALAVLQKAQLNNKILAECIGAKSINRPLTKYKNWCKIYQKMTKIKQFFMDKSYLTFRDVCVATFDYLKQQSDMIDRAIDEDISQFLEITDQYLEEIDVEERKKQPVGCMIRHIEKMENYKISQIVKQKIVKHNKHIYGDNNRIHEFLNKQNLTRWQDKEDIEKIQERKEIQQQFEAIKQQPKQAKVELSRNKKKCKLQILTIFGSKGLTFKAVFLCSMNYLYTTQFAPDFKNQLPEQSKNFDNLNVDKVKQIVQKSWYERLIYTAITRSSHYLFISSSKQDRNCAKIRKEHPLFAKLYLWLKKQEKVEIQPYDEIKHGMLNAKIKKHQRIE